MSKLSNTLDKLKELADKVETAVNSNIELRPTNESQVEEMDVPGGQGQEEILSTALRETSPMKERIFQQFSKFSPGGQRETLRTLKGKDSFGSLDLEPDPVDCEGRVMAHSYSEVSLSQSVINIVETDPPRPPSEVFSFDKHDFSMAASPTGGGEDSSPMPSIPETPTKSRKRFPGIPSFLARRNHSSAPPPELSTSPPRVTEPHQETKTETPKRTLRSILGSYTGGSKVVSVPGSPTGETDPVPPTPVAEAPIPGLPDLRESREESPVSEVEEGQEAAEAELTVQHTEDEQDGSTECVGERTGREPIFSRRVTPSPPVFQPPPALTELVSPLLVGCLAVANILAPAWLAGFATGLTLSLLLTYWVVSYLYPPVSYTPSTLAHTGQGQRIEVHEPPQQFQAWMNLLPPGCQPYSPDTYEVRQTVSVRLSVEHHMLKIEYPERNIPKRLGPGEDIPAQDIKFLFHCDHVDLSTAKISLLPHGIVGKRMFSKKYPIEVKPCGLLKEEESLAKIIKKTKEKEIEDTDENTFHDVEEFEPAELAIVKNSKVYYLFARADREKEDVYKALLDAHNFLGDTVLDVARREGAITEGIDREAGGRETVRERKQRFQQFMDNVMDSHNQQPPLEDSKESRGSENDCLKFLNIYLNRVFYDIHKSEEMKAFLRSRIYNKLMKIKITQWFKSIALTEINMGSSLPRILWVREVMQDSRGLWAEVGLQYGGVASATIETCGVNLGEEEPGAVHLRDLLSQGESCLESAGLGLPVQQQEGGAGVLAATNSSEEDSGEEDSEDSSSEQLPLEQVVGAEQQGSLRSGGGRWWELVGNSELVKSGINRLSNSEWWKAKTSKKVTLHLEIASLTGVLVLNIPPPPSDRLWYGFKEKPDLELRIVPFYGDNKLGEDSTFFSSAVNKGLTVLVNRLKEEIYKFVLLPNMDDIPMRIMDPFPPSNIEEGVKMVLE